MNQPHSDPANNALEHVSRAETEVSKIPGIGKDTNVLTVGRAAVIGAGTMGRGIAMTFANAGIPVIVKEASRECLENGIAAIQKNYESSAKRGRCTPESVEQRLKLIRPALTYEGFTEADVVVEAVFESMELKKQVFGELDNICKLDAILATNTSSLDIDRIAAVTSRPQRVIGHHFFAPPHVMRLLEIVRGRWTGEEAIASSLELAAKLGKIGVVVGNCRGFVGNRMYHQYQREAQFLVEEGAEVRQVDTVLRNFGMAMGPLAAGDLSGLDVGWRIRKEQRQSEPAHGRRPLVADRLCELGRYGQKTGAGWYRYGSGDRSPIPDPEVEKIAAECARESGILRRVVSSQEIVERTIYALINEGAKILEEGIALRAADIDVIFINGYGFPAHLGGPMWFADTLGLKEVYETLRRFEQLHGALFAPAPLLKRLVDEGRTFADWDSWRIRI